VELYLHSQYAFIAWCSVKAQGQLYLFYFYLIKSVRAQKFVSLVNVVMANSFLKTLFLVRSLTTLNFVTTIPLMATLRKEKCIDRSLDRQKIFDLKNDNHLHCVKILVDQVIISSLPKKKIATFRRLVCLLQAGTRVTALWGHIG